MIEKKLRFRKIRCALWIAGIPILLACLFACDSSQDDTKPVVKPPTPEPSFNADVEPQAEPNTYQVRLRWDATQPPSAWIIQREERNQWVKHLVTLEGRLKEYADQNVLPGETYRYVIGRMEPGNYVVMKEVTAKIPRDYEITGVSSDREIKGFNRLFFRAGSRIDMNGNGLQIEVNEVISDGGVVQSFPENQTAGYGAAGRSGGEIVVKAKTGKGTLFVYGRGENGGPGVPGKVGGPGKKGQAGRSGLATHETVNVVCNCGPRSRELREQARQGNPLAMFQYVVERNRHRCISQTGDGAPGEIGGPGGDGGAGGRGGDSGKVSVEISDPTLLQVKAHLVPGKGGTGGTPGEGGAGGAGGNPGDKDLDYYDVCRNGVPGPTGPQGPRGRSGSRGEDGKELGLCLKLGLVNIGDCDK